MSDEQPRCRFAVGFARTPEALLEAQRLRYRIFAGELGAEIDGGASGIDTDHYDAFCRHLIVRDTVSGQVIACTRLLTDDQAPRAGGFYSANEFDLKMLESLPGRVMEVGRTCVDAEFRTGAVIACLWSGLANFVVEDRIDYLFGCASIGLEDGGATAHALLDQIQAKYMAPSRQHVFPLTPLPAADARPPDKAKMPALLKAYFSLGGKACGEPYWDRKFNCADVFVLVSVSELHSRYARHFVQRQREPESGELPLQRGRFGNC